MAIIRDNSILTWVVLDSSVIVTDHKVSFSSSSPYALEDFHLVWSNWFITASSPEGFRLSNCHASLPTLNKALGTNPSILSCYVVPMIAFFDGVITTEPTDTHESATPITDFGVETWIILFDYWS